MNYIVEYKNKSSSVNYLKDTGSFCGYASTYSIDDVGDCILPGAFTETLFKTKNNTNRRMPILWNHEQGRSIGYIEDLFEDTKGLFIKGNLLLDLQDARDAYLRLTNNMLGLSIGFSSIKSFREGNIRYIQKLELYECSLVEIPANKESNILEFKSIISVSKNMNNIDDKTDDIETINSSIQILTKKILQQ